MGLFNYFRVIMYSGEEGNFLHKITYTTIEDGDQQYRYKSNFVKLAKTQPHSNRAHQVLFIDLRHIHCLVQSLVQNSFKPCFRPQAFVT